jgi:hypothetical protein
MNDTRNTPAPGRALMHGELTEQVIGALSGLLLHFGPEANFFRIINSKRREDRPGSFRDASA